MNTGHVKLWSALLFVVVGSAHAHHSAGSYDVSKQVVLTGKVVELQFKNPHSVLIIDVPVAGGKIERWDVESAPSTSAAAMAGTKILSGRVKPSRSRETRTGIQTLSRSREDSSTLRIGHFLGSLVTKAAPVQITAKHLGLSGISGRWRPPFRGPRSMPRLKYGSPLPLTPAGLKAWENYRPERSPATTCEPMTIPTLLYVGYVVDIRLGQNEAVITV